MKPSEQLAAAKALIIDPAHWVQEVYARNAHGSPCTPQEADATCFCSLGAVHRVAPYHSLAFAYLGQAAHQLAGDECVSDLNDTRTHAEVMAMFDLAITLAQKDEA